MRVPSLSLALDQTAILDPSADRTDLDRLREIVNFEAVEGTLAFSDRVQTLKNKLGEHWAELGVLGRLFFVNIEAPVEEYSRVESALTDHLRNDSYCWTALRTLQSDAACHRGEISLSQFYVRDVEQRIKETEHPLIAELCQAMAKHSSGLLEQSLGDYNRALEDYNESAKLSRKHGLRLAPIAAMDLAGLYWASGQYRVALELHTDPEHRADALSTLGPGWMIRSHLSAAKCAIDCDEYLIADKELRASEQLLRETERLHPMLKGYQLLRKGELLLKSVKGKDPRGFDLLEEACQYFESMDPVFYTGLIDAKISITQYAISTADHPRMFGVLHSIFAEAEEKGCLEARARCLVFESSLFVSENPPLRTAFDDLVARLHLINNPALLMQALANLFTYSLRYLAEPDQAFLMARLRNLQKVLDKSCYQDLYETFIEMRYSWAIENRLAEFLEGDEQLYGGDRDAAR